MNHKTDTLVSDLMNMGKGKLELDDPKTLYPVCKICFLNKNPITLINDLIAPCGCKGSIKYVHKTCLKLWRFKGKNIREIKRCEQCLCEYRYLGDYIPHNVVVKLTTIFAIGVVFLVLHVVMSFLFQAVMFLIHDDLDDIAYDEFIESLSFKNRTEKMLENQRNYYREKRINVMADIAKYKMQYTYKTSVVFFLTVYVFAFRWSFWPVLNLLFTVWRVYQFDMCFDRYFLSGIISYYVYKLYSELYLRIDTLYVFILNYNA